MIETSKILAGLPYGLRDPLIANYNEIALNFTIHKWEPSELNGGKLCEVVYSIINGYLSGKFPSKPSKPQNMLQACQTLENTPKDPNRIGDRSIRILIPRVLPILYEIRNNRGVGHVGGEVDPNYLDATAVYSMSSWILAELIRIFHNITTAEAQDVVDTIVERKHPLIWEVGDLKRVLDSSMSKRNQALLLLHHEYGWVNDSELSTWIEYSSVSMFRTRILSPLHKDRLVEFDKGKNRVRISPKGVNEVELKIHKANEK